MTPLEAQVALWQYVLAMLTWAVVGYGIGMFIGLLIVAGRDLYTAFKDSLTR